MRLPGHLLASLLLIIAALASGAAVAGKSFLRLDRAEFVASDAAEPPPDSAAWQPQSLPDDWDITRPGLSGVGWYRLRFELMQPVPARPAVYTPRMGNVGAVYLNGTLVGQTGIFGRTDPVVAPVLFAFSPQLLRPGSNTLHVRLWSPPTSNKALAPIRIGDQALLGRELERERFVHVTVAQMAGVFSGTVGVFMLLIWLQRRHDPMYGYFGAAALLSAMWPWQWLGNDGHLVSQLFAFIRPVLLFIYCLRFAGWRWPRAERAAWIFTAVLGLAAVLDTVFPGHLWLAQTWHAYLAIPCATVLVLLYIVPRQPSLQAALLLCGHVASVIALAIAMFTPQLEGLDYRAMNLVPLYLVMGWMLTRRFVQSLNETDHLNVNLEQRVAERHAELEREQARLQALTRQSVISEERERIISDMHDGLGVQLMATLGRAEDGDITAQQVAAALRECIDDLRLAIDSLQPTDDDLLGVLGNLRYRLESRLQAQGIALDWQVRDVPALACLTPRNVLHILRILQEAFTNIVKHAQASRIRVTTAVDAQRVKIDVSDDGRGFEVDNAERGEAHGLAKMRRRAKTIGGELLVMPTPSGTTLSLLLPRG